MAVILANNVASTLAQDLSAASGSLRVKGGTGARFPVITAGLYYYLTVISPDGRMEIVKATARTSDQITVSRAQEGTLATTFPSGSRVELRTTAQSIRDAIADKAIHVGTSPPENPVLNMLWVDTN